MNAPWDTSTPLGGQVTGQFHIQESPLAMAQGALWSQENHRMDECVLYFITLGDRQAETEVLVSVLLQP